MTCKHFLLLAFWITASPLAAQTPTPADLWITNAVAYPAPFDARLVHPNDFAAAHAEVLAGKLKLVWPAAPHDTNVAVTAHVSADAEGHWPARDWHSHPMTLRGTTWETTAPVDDVNVPLVYFIAIRERGTTNLSPMRVCLPRAAGLEEPTRVFWPFLDGFEQGLEGWRPFNLANEIPALRTDDLARSGRASLLISVPAGRRSAAVATTRVRGWQLLQQGVTGLRVWLRTRAGEGRVRFTLMTDAFTTNEVAAVFPTDIPLGTAWRKADLPFTIFPKLSLGQVDLFVLEFIAADAQDFLVDDLQLLGPWKLDPE